MSRFSLPFIVAVTLLASWTWAQEPQPRTINTSGDATVYVAPGEVVVNIGVETFDPQLDQAKALNDQACSRLLKAIKEMQIEDKRVQTAHLDLDIRYHDSNHPSRGIEGYYARKMYSVTLKDPKQFETFVDTALKNGANRLLGFEFRDTELRKHRDEARKMAIRAAKEKAEALAAELNCRIGSPRSIHENSWGYVGYASNFWAWGGWGGGQYSSQNSMQSIGGAGEGGETMPLGQIGIRANVQVVFDLVPQ